MDKGKNKEKAWIQIDSSESSDSEPESPDSEDNGPEPSPPEKPLEPALVMPKGCIANIAVTYGNQRAYFVRPPSFELFVKETRESFKIPEDVALCFTYFPYSGSRVSKKLVEAAYDGLPQNIIVYAAPEEGSVVLPPNLKLRIYYDGGCNFEVIPKSTWDIRTLKNVIAKKTEYEYEFLRLTHGGKPLDDCEMKLFKCHFEHENEIDKRDNRVNIDVDAFFGAIKHGLYLDKPVGPRPLRLALTLQCTAPLTIARSSVEAFDPPATLNQHLESYTWNVDLHGHRSTSTIDGNIQSLRDPKQWYRYLFWHGETCMNRDRMAPVGWATGQAGAEAQPVFNPWRPDMTPENSVILPVSDTFTFLSHVFSQLGCTPIMQTEFFLAWAPRFSRINDYWTHIAFRFVDPVAFNNVARLTVTTPDSADPSHSVPHVMARILLLFGGVRTTKSAWKRRVKTLVQAMQIDWVDAINLDVRGMRDSWKLRIVEMGAMEVPLFKQS